MADAEEKARQEKIAAAKKRVSIAHGPYHWFHTPANPMPGGGNEEEEEQEGRPIQKG
jgi:hypothetical protein